jgi:hypothetical protein
LCEREEGKVDVKGFNSSNRYEREWFCADDATDVWDFHYHTYLLKNVLKNVRKRMNWKEPKTDHVTISSLAEINSRASVSGVKANGNLAHISIQKKRSRNCEFSSATHRTEFLPPFIHSFFLFLPFLLWISNKCTLWIYPFSIHPSSGKLMRERKNSIENHFPMPVSSVRAWMRSVLIRARLALIFCANMYVYHYTLPTRHQRQHPHSSLIFQWYVCKTARETRLFFVIIINNNNMITQWWVWFSFFNYTEMNSLRQS